MNMTRRSFLKTLAALSAVPVIARIPVWVDAPITVDNPLAWLYLDGERFVLDSFMTLHYSQIRYNDDGRYRDNHWTAECRLAGDVLDELRVFGGENRNVAMRIVPPNFDSVFTGTVRTSIAALTRGRNRDVASAILLFGSGVLGVEDAV